MLESLLQLLQRFLKSPNQIRQIHSRLITNGHLRRNPNPKFSTLFYNTLIRAHLGFGEAHKALLLFSSPTCFPTKPTPTATPSLRSSKPSPAAVASRVPAQPKLRNAAFGVTRLYAGFGEVCDARKVFDEMTEPCVVAFNALSDGFGKNGDMIWVVLFRYSKVWQRGTSGFGEEKIEMKLQPQHCGRYLVLSNIHAGNDRWDHRIPAQSLIDGRFSGDIQRLDFMIKLQTFATKE